VQGRIAREGCCDEKRKREGEKPVKPTRGSWYEKSGHASRWRFEGTCLRGGDQDRRELEGRDSAGGGDDKKANALPMKEGRSESYARRANLAKKRREPSRANAREKGGDQGNDERPGEGKRK